MVEKNKLLSDLLDDQCDSADFDDLLAESDIAETWYRYQTASALLKDQQSAHSSFEFCSQISAKIAEEPAIIAAPKTTNSTPKRKQTAEVRRIGGGFAIAASVAVATFFSVQSINVADVTAPMPQQGIAAEDNNQAGNSVDNQHATLNNIITKEQKELDLMDDIYRLDFERSERGKFAPVSGVFVKTKRLSAEEWQAILENSLRRQKAIEEARAQESSEDKQ